MVAAINDISLVKRNVFTMFLLSLSLGSYQQPSLMLVIVQLTNHLLVGFLYIVYGLIGGSFGYGLSLILRIELALPGFIVCSSLQAFKRNVWMYEWRNLSLIWHSDNCM